MLTLTLLAAPDRADLTDSALSDLGAVWPLGEARWLSPGVAVEADLASTPPDLWEQWRAWQDRGHDLVVQPAGGRRKQVLLADMDSTMVQQECIDELAAHAGVGDLVSGITARAMNGELDFAEALHERVALLQDLPTSVVGTVLAERITYTPGGAELVATMRAKGAYTALVSGGFTPFTEAVAAALGFDEHRANTLAVAGGRFTGRVVEPVVGREAKVAALREITARLGLTPREVIAVGDGANDLDMLHLAGTGVALHAKPVVAERCDVRVNHGDLTALLYLQGYAAHDVVRP
ncbi:phosphoserine phosphatase SerB [Ornithinimicrobium pekingense]|uniref:phosphoserine phosphatase n=1 Tax=Ornithinimicrobium pekingense TaxID=384677 RepID=A0ABQ2F8U4_9MICO|nr:phosphoserine phosphatase SerB [Ornithinimicrobium pekingense]GGK62559.1 phosphoserine phosphatase SerB [Ornithinimicrobium pekingense]